MEPTKEQQIELWEWCEWSVRISRAGTPFWHHPLLGNERWTGAFPLAVDVNNLFKYAIGKVKKELGDKEYFKFLIRWVFRMVEADEDPALALFWAIYELRSQALR